IMGRFSEKPNPRAPALSGGHPRVALTAAGVPFTLVKDQTHPGPGRVPETGRTAPRTQDQGLAPGQAMAGRALVASRRPAGLTVPAVLRAHLRLSWAAARRLVEQRRVRLAGAPCLDPARRVAAGQRLEIQATPTRPGPHAGKPRAPSRRAEQTDATVGRR